MRRTEVDGAVRDAFRTEWGPVVAAVIRQTGDWDLAEEAAQDAFARALATWARDGVPDRPGAWLTTVARRRAIDLLRKRAGEEQARREIAVLDSDDGDPRIDPSGVEDDLLRLAFTCCHPALSLENRVALTMRTMLGLTVEQIAGAFLVPEQTMAKRLVRAKAKIRDARIPYRVPEAHELPHRLPAVLAVVYLVFAGGYASKTGPELLDTRLTDDAIRLGRLLAELMPDEPEVHGLLALMLLQGSRSAARSTAAGDLVRLPDQDRSRWDPTMISDGMAELAAARRGGPPGPYELQAAIAACHAAAPTAGDTDWQRITELYDALAEVRPTPVVHLNRAVAVAQTRGPGRALEILESLADDPPMRAHHLYAATRAEMLHRLGRQREATGHWRRAAALAPTDAERRHLTARLAGPNG